MYCFRAMDSIANICWALNTFAGNQNPFSAPHPSERAPTKIKRLWVYGFVETHQQFIRGVVPVCQVGLTDSPISRDLDDAPQP